MKLTDLQNENITLQGNIKILLNKEDGEQITLDTIQDEMLFPKILKEYETCDIGYMYVKNDYLVIELNENY